MRRTKTIEELLPWLYLKGISTGDFSEALAALVEARERFTQLDEPGSVAVIWHQTGIAYHRSDQPEAAEDAYRKSLALKVRLGDVDGQEHAQSTR